MSRKNTSPPYLEEFFFWHPAPLLRPGSVLEQESSIRVRVPCDLFAPASSVLAKGQPWFYLRLATKRGTIALLGCPREHTVPRETLRLTLRGYLPSTPSASRPPDLATETMVRLPISACAQAACSFRCSASNLSPFFQIFSGMAAILRASVSRAISGRMPLSSSPR